MTVEENLVTGAASGAAPAGREPAARISSDVYATCPRASSRKAQGPVSGLTSGGEQQMTAIGRGLMAAPRLLVLDEPSMGLAPLTTIDIFEALKTLKQERGLTIVFCEQNTCLATRYADRVLALSNGTSIASDGGTTTSLDAAYFGDVVELRYAAAGTFQLDG